MSEEKPFVSMLGSVMRRYVDLKHALGRGFRNGQAVLLSLDQFLADGGNADLTGTLFQRWCEKLGHLSNTDRRKRMQVVRAFCLYRQRDNPSFFVPDTSLFPTAHQPVLPYIFAESEIKRLLEAAGSLKATSCSPLRPQLFRLAIVLLYTTGLRRGEFTHLRIGDYNEREHTLLVRESKFHRSRLLPLSADAAREIDDYLQARRTKGFPVSADSPITYNCHRGGGSYSGSSLREGIRRLFEVVDIRRPDGSTPRVHDLRHSFAVHALLRWYRNGDNVQAKLPLLATYMGHVSIVSTEYYLRLVEPLAARASERFGQYCAGLVTVAPN